MCRLSWNLGASTSWNPQGMSRPVMGLFYLYLLLCRTHVQLRSGLTHTNISEADTVSTAGFSKLWVKRQGYNISHSLSFHYCFSFPSADAHLSAHAGTSLQQQVPTALSRPTRPQYQTSPLSILLSKNQFYIILFFSRWSHPWFMRPKIRGLLCASDYDPLI